MSGSMMRGRMRLSSSGELFRGALSLGQKMFDRDDGRADEGLPSRRDDGLRSRSKDGLRFSSAIAYLLYIFTRSIFHYVEKTLRVFTLGAEKKKGHVLRCPFLM
jgi:hypothetical protein